MIAYKVVSNERKSWMACNKAGPKKSKYILTYRKGQIVEAPEGSLGIFVFSNKLYAKRFASNGFILKVKTIGRKKIPKRIAHWTSILKFRYFYECLKKRNNPYSSRNIPKGTICYPAVEVLD